MVSALTVPAVLAVFAFVFWYRASKRKAARKFCEEFARLFPGRCLICAYHAYGRREFGIRKPVHPHRCIEGKSHAAD